MREPSSEPLPDFTTGEGLRVLLEQLTAEQLWRTHPAARALMRYAQEKYLPLARSWHRDPADAAYEAFMAMRTPAIRRAAASMSVTSGAAAAPSEFLGNAEIL